MNNLFGQNYPIVMGILNVTPDSFSDGGNYFQHDTAVKHVNKMIADGAAIIDIGGESTRPGAEAVSIDEECQRVIPVITAIRNESDIPISIDTSKAAVMSEAVNAGASMINDVNALRSENALIVSAQLDVPVCIMHMQGEPRSMQHKPAYEDVVTEIKEFLSARINDCVEAGIKHENIIVDPGFGFGKTVAHNFSLFKHLDEFLEFNVPLLIGVSRKSMIGAVLNNAPVDERLHGSVALATLAAWMNASILRVHDVKATADALKLCWAIKEAK
ncbi:MAG: dihydropteroate synthase [Gammaproteobacteria bacterium]|nr:dihydropteroate synthase [Gammaproteobacteria bacterium]